MTDRLEINTAAKPKHEPRYNVGTIFSVQGYGNFRCFLGRVHDNKALLFVLPQQNHQGKWSDLGQPWSLKTIPIKYDPETGVRYVTGEDFHKEFPALRYKAVEK